MDIKELARVREQIEAGTYLTEEKWQVAISRLFLEIGLDNAYKTRYTSGESTSSLEGAAYKRRLLTLTRRC